MDYKRILKNKETRIRLLRLLRFIPDYWMLKLQYRIKLGRRLNLKNPQRWTEKLQWYKLNYRSNLMTKCADKYEVREYVKSKGLEDILNKLYFVYEDVEQIDEEKLSQKFVVKTTNGSGTNVICEDKTKLDVGKMKSDLATWMNRDNFSSGREWSYHGVKARIIVEEYLEDPNDKFEGINDYKFLCFNGQPKYIILDVDRFKDHKRNIYNQDWKFIDVETDRPNLGDAIPRPVELDEMLAVAKQLAADFPFVRVDLYLVNKKIYFGELTFYPWTGYVQFKPDAFDFILGGEFILPKQMA